MEIIKTGSISQDALRLGFQTTCEKGVATLLKVDDITIEECASFKERHLAEVKENVHTIIKDYGESEARKFKKFADSSHDILSLGLWQIRKIIRFSRINNNIAKQQPRQYRTELIEIKQPKLNIYQGVWETTVRCKVIAEQWEGFYCKEYRKFEYEEEETSLYIRTDARKCNVKYIPYDNYSDKYIPDEAVQAAYDAIQIGMTNLRVAIPKVNNVVTDRDPIIVGNVGEQMFIIAWFGYDKNNHMSCNI